MSHREIMGHLVKHEHIAPQDVEQAMLVSQVYPSTCAWQAFMSRLLLSFGALALVCGTVFFVAANWLDMGRFIKFVLLQLLLVAAVITYLRLEKHPLLGQLALTVAFILLGTLMAYFGQTYQTGADPWQLFFNWVCLGFPWVVIGRFAPLWMLWLSLANLSIFLYHGALSAHLLFGLGEDERLFGCWLILNTFSLVMWEWRRVKHPWLNHAWVGRIIALWTIFCSTGFALVSMFAYQTSWIGSIVWLLLMVLAYAVYRKLRPNLFILTLCCLSGIVVTVAWSVKTIDHIGSKMMLELLFLLTIGLASAAAIWLKKLTKEFH